MTRAYRELASWIGIVAVIFAQLAVSAYACPLLLQSAADSADAVVLADATSDSSGFVSSGLCQKHCENEQQNVKDTSQPLASVALEPAFVVLVAMNSPEPLSARAYVSSSLFHATSPPHSIRNCCFRI